MLGLIAMALAGCASSGTPSPPGSSSVARSPSALSTATPTASELTGATGSSAPPPATTAVATQAARPNPPAAGPTPLPAPDLRAVLFVDALHGWAAGAQRIVGTTDGGASWTVQYPGPEVIKQLDLLNQQEGWAVAEHALIRTTDGRNWTPAAEPPEPLEQVRFLSPKVGYGVASGKLYRTSDAAATWQEIPAPIAAGGLCFVNEATGWVVNLNGFAAGSSPPASGTRMFATATAGQSWHEVTLPKVGFGFPLPQELQCVLPNVLWDLVVGDSYAGGEGYWLYRSPDGGQTWKAVIANPNTASAKAPPGPKPGALSVVDAASAFLSGWCGACWPPGPHTPPALTVGRTLDGGQTWHNFPVPGQPPGLSDIAFISAQQGWLAWRGTPAEPSKILTTNDGGQTWVEQYSST